MVIHVYLYSPDLRICGFALVATLISALFRKHMSFVAPCDSLLWKKHHGRTLGPKIEALLDNPAVQQHLSLDVRTLTFCQLVSFPLNH